MILSIKWFGYFCFCIWWPQNLGLSNIISMAFFSFKLVAVCFKSRVSLSLSGYLWILWLLTWRVIRSTPGMVYPSQWLASHRSGVHTFLRTHTHTLSHVHFPILKSVMCGTWRLPCRWKFRARIRRCWLLLARCSWGNRRLRFPTSPWRHWKAIREPLLLTWPWR